MDPFRLCLALGPAAVYVLLLGAINLSRRPFLVTGTRDAAALGLAIAGFVIVGPMELFFPNAAAARFGPFVWVLLIALYGLCLVGSLLMLRPRLIVYNISLDQLRPVLAEVVAQFDEEARWAGDSLFLPGLGVQLHLDHVPGLRNVSLKSVGTAQDYVHWKRLEVALAHALGQVEVRRNPRAISLLTAGVLCIALLVLAIARDPEAVAGALFEMLRL